MKKPSDGLLASEGYCPGHVLPSPLRQRHSESEWKGNRMRSAYQLGFFLGVAERVVCVFWNISFGKEGIRDSAESLLTVGTLGR